MNVLDVDLSVNPRTTGAILIEPVGTSTWRATELPTPPTDDALVEVARIVEVVGVDSPLGWPTAFVEAVAAHGSLRPWPGGVDRCPLTHRDTDRVFGRAANSAIRPQGTPDVGLQAPDWETLVGQHRAAR